MKRARQLTLSNFALPMLALFVVFAAVQWSRGVARLLFPVLLLAFGLFGTRIGPARSQSSALMRPLGLGGRVLFVGWGILCIFVALRGL